MEMASFTDETVAWDDWYASPAFDIQPRELDAPSGVRDVLNRDTARKLRLKKYSFVLLKVKGDIEKGLKLPRNWNMARVDQAGGHQAGYAPDEGGISVLVALSLIDAVHVPIREYFESIYDIT